MMACEGRRPGDDDQSALTHRCRTDCVRVCVTHFSSMTRRMHRDACSHWRRLRRQIPARFRRTTLTDWLNDVIPSLSIPVTGVSPFHSKRLPVRPADDVQENDGLERMTSRVRLGGMTASARDRYHGNSYWSDVCTSDTWRHRSSQRQQQQWQWRPLALIANDDRLTPARQSHTAWQDLILRPSERRSVGRTESYRPAGCTDQQYYVRHWLAAAADIHIHAL